MCESYSIQLRMKDKWNYYILDSSRILVTGSRSTFRIHGSISNQRMSFAWYDGEVRFHYYLLRTHSKRPRQLLATAQDAGSRDSLGIHHFTHGIHILVHGPPWWVAFLKVDRPMNESDLKTTVFRRKRIL